MCGILFLYESELTADERRARGDAALAQIVHRGPDDGGLVHAGPAMVGHRRLSIIDLAASRQPMSDPSDRYLLAYNGETYNFRELRDGLTGHWEFRTHGDTEVVLAGLVTRGPDFLKQMEGMWALCLWDTRDNRLLLARDRMGKKPLYYQSSPRSMACASELSALVELVRSPWQEDLDSAADYLRYGLYLPGTTAYQGVREVLPGHYLQWTPGQEAKSQPYWALSVGGFVGTKDSAREELQDAFMSAVQKRLVADVEVGAFLSGGVDSSMVVSAMTRHFNTKPKTFTIGFSEASYDERDFARSVARRCGTEHFEECLRDWNPDSLKELVLGRVGQPFADASLLPTALVSRLAANHVKVALSGDGGDELFSGYQRYQARALLRWYTRLPAPLRKSAERMIVALPEPMAHHSRSLLKKAHLFREAVARQSSEAPYVAPRMQSDEQFAAMAPDLVGRGHVPPNLPDACRLDDVEEMMAADALVYLPQDILVKVDRASMAHSLEVRAPFLDRRLVELAFSLPRRWHRRGLSGKRMLREALGSLLDPAIWGRCKQGFGVPLHEWFRGALTEDMVRLLSILDLPFRREYAENMLAEHRARQRDHGLRLWALYVYLIWREHGCRPGY